MKIEFDSIEDMKKFLDDLGYDIQPKESKKHPMTNAEKQKAYRERKKATDGNETVTESNVTEQEKREEKEEGFPPLSPLSLSPNTPYPIPPIIPPSEEEKGERKEKRAPKHQHGYYRHVLLTDDEYGKLCEKFNDVGTKIQKLDDYLENNRKKHYDNHYLTILNWARKDTQTSASQKKTWSASEVVEMMSRGEL